MHIFEGAISNEINAATAIISVSAIGIALYKGKGQLDEREVPLLGMTGAFIFAAQMINFPIAGGTSGHLLGAVLAALLVGPLYGVLVMALVLGIQAVMFADGGITALGTNIFNMAIVSGFSGYAVFWLMKKALPHSKSSFLASAAVASWISVVLGSIACGMELGLSGKGPIGLLVGSMAGVHSLIGVGEALITTTVLSLVLSARPDLLKKCYQAPAEKDIDQRCQLVEVTP